MTRFWITINQGVDFVLSCLEIMQGGEIFVPRIPSMRMTDLAEALAPGIPVENIGIRPGEKLHEVMITEDDSRKTYLLDDRYVILPSFAFWDGPQKIPSNAKMAEEGFRYSSDNNNEWLDHDGLFEMLRSSGYKL
jgi:UDP-N-acetylglucosamine 4,6-dehydratase